eukprot:scaffold28520_cov124-Isochrysis_galbana.AAC.3
MMGLTHHRLLTAATLPPPPTHVLVTPSPCCSCQRQRSWSPTDSHGFPVAAVVRSRAHSGRGGVTRCGIWNIWVCVRHQFINGSSRPDAGLFPHAPPGVHASQA